MITAEEARKIYASSAARKESVLSTLRCIISNAAETGTFTTIDMFFDKCKEPSRYRGKQYIENVSETLVMDIFQTLKELGYGVSIETTNEDDEWFNKFTIRW